MIMNNQNNDHTYWDDMWNQVDTQNKLEDKLNILLQGNINM